MKALVPWVFVRVKLWDVWSLDTRLYHATVLYMGTWDSLVTRPTCTPQFERRLSCTLWGPKIFQTCLVFCKTAWNLGCVTVPTSWGSFHHSESVSVCECVWRPISGPCPPHYPLQKFYIIQKWEVSVLVSTVMIFQTFFIIVLIYIITLCNPKALLWPLKWGTQGLRKEKKWINKLLKS